MCGWFESNRCHQVVGLNSGLGFCNHGAGINSLAVVHDGRFLNVLAEACFNNASIPKFVFAVVIHIFNKRFAPLA